MVVIVIAVVAVILGIIRYNVTSGGKTVPVVSSLDVNKISYVIDGETLALGDSLKVFGQPVYGDFNSDGKQDAAVLLVSNPGGSGTFYYAVLAINKGDKYVATNALLLGDRIAPQTVEVREGRAIYNYADRALTDPMVTPPSIGKSLWVNYNSATGQISAGTEMSLWSQELKMVQNSSSSVTFNYPDHILTNYISTVDWPPKVEIVKGPYTCAGVTREIAQQSICLTRESEGAAGSTYTNYAYALNKGDRTIIFTFSLRSVQCANYDEPKHSACDLERANFGDPGADEAVAKILATLKW